MTGGSSRVIVHGICNGEWFFTAVVHGICNGEWFFTGYGSRYLQWRVVLHGFYGSRYLQWQAVLHGLWFTVFAMTGGSSRVMVHGICNGEWFFTGYGSRYLQWRVVLHGLWFTVFAMASGSSRVIVHGICNGEWFFTAVVHGICNGEWFFTGYGSRYLQWRVVLHGLWFTIFVMASGSSRVTPHFQSNTKNRGVPNVAFTSNLHFKQYAHA